MNDEEKQLWFDVFHKAYGTYIPGDGDCYSPRSIGVTEAAMDADLAVEKYRRSMEKLDES